MQAKASFFFFMCVCLWYAKLIMCYCLLKCRDEIHVDIWTCNDKDITLSRATEQYCAAGAILKPLCLSKQLTLCSQQHIDQFFPGHIV